jgi:biopolymer transport protein ExbD
MKSTTRAWLAGTILIAGIGAQTPAIKKGVSVAMPIASHAVEVREADDRNARTIAITANGTVFVGIEPTEPAGLNNLSESTVYVKADVRAPYQAVLAVLNALHGKSLVLLSAPPEVTPTQGYVPSYGTKLIVSR